MQNIIIELLEDKRRVNQDRAELVRKRIKILSGKEKHLMQMYFENGCSCWLIAGLLGVHESNVSRQIRKITNRLMAGQFIRCMRNRDFLSPEQLEIARDYFVRRRGLRQIARREGFSVHQVRKIIERIDAVIDVAEGRRKES
jgi:DNA-binding CsgD family transcriptional regulator